MLPRRSWNKYFPRRSVNGGHHLVATALPKAPCLYCQLLLWNYFNSRFFLNIETSLTPFSKFSMLWPCPITARIPSDFLAYSLLFFTFSTAYQKGIRVHGSLCTPYASSCNVLPFLGNHPNIMHRSPRKTLFSNCFYLIFTVSAQVTTMQSGTEGNWKIIPQNHSAVEFNRSAAHWNFWSARQRGVFEESWSRNMQLDGCVKLDVCFAQTELNWQNTGTVNVLRFGSCRSVFCNLLVTVFIS